MGWWEVHHSDMQLHARILLLDCIQADTKRLRVGTQQQGQWEQPTWIPPNSLREGPDASEWPLPWLLHGICVIGFNTLQNLCFASLVTLLQHLHVSVPIIRFQITPLGTSTSWVWSMTLRWSTIWSWACPGTSTTRTTGQHTSWSSATSRRVRSRKGIGRTPSPSRQADTPPPHV